MTAITKGRKHGTKQPSKSKPSTEYPSSPYPKALRPLHSLFVDHYMIHFNGTQAAKDAGFSKRTAGSQAHDLLKRPDVAAEIRRRRQALAEPLHNITRERFEREIAAGAFANMGDYAPMFGEGTPAEKLALLTREQAAAVQEIVVEEFRDGRTRARQVRRTRFKLVSKDRNLELLGKAKGWVSDKVDHKHDHQHLILAVMLKRIAAAEDGKPIVDIEVGQVEDQRPDGEAA